MANWHLIARLRDYGMGVAGRVIGPPCDIYRPTLSGDFLQAGNKIGRRHVFRRINVSRENQETPSHSFGTLFYQVLVDATFWKLGDVFVEVDPFYGAGSTSVTFATDQFEAYCLCSHGPIKPIIAARVDRPAQIFRPVTAPDPRAFFTPTPGGNIAPVTNVGGVWGLGATTDTPSAIPVGMMAMPRDRDQEFRPAPGDTGSSAWFCYVPPLKGFNPREGDIVFVDNGRYIVKHPYQQQAGAVGSQLLLARVIGNS